VSEARDQAYWDRRYRERPAIWSGRPNHLLVEEVADLGPGRALDVGCGEGADAVWLASQGWRVTGVDLSGVALERAQAHAVAAGLPADAVEWRRADVLAWQPPPAAFDLVSVQFMQLPPEERLPLWRSLAAAVAAGGSLLIVGHHPSDLDTTVRRPRDPDLYFTGADVISAVGDGWSVATDRTPGREVEDPEGRTVTVRDAVIRLVRRT
jgi:SAM-dependent methyltransferase